MATKVSQFQLVGALGAAVAIILSVSGSCDKAIETRITGVKDAARERSDGLEARVRLLENWRLSREGKP